MTQEEKQLLIKDLCARAPYRPKVKVLHVWNEEKEIEEDIVDTVYCVFPEGYINTGTIDSDIPLNDNIVLYLRPMSSMTQEEEKEVRKLGVCDDGAFHNDIYDVGISMEEAFLAISWFLERHFDINYLIEKGLALEAPEGIYKTE